MLPILLIMFILSTIRPVLIEMFQVRFQASQMVDL
jgi:hypothetical protein